MENSLGRNNPKVQFSDSSSLDAFGRLRVSSPEYVADAQMTYDLQPLFYEQITSGTGAAIAHDATNRSATLSFTGVTGTATTKLQSYEHHRYQAGRSHLFLGTFNFNSTTAQSGVTKFVGYSDLTNGVRLCQDSTGVSICLDSATTSGGSTIAQSSWNIDKLNGTGKSGITMDWTKTQILYIDLQALYVGRVRVGFSVDGGIFYAHEIEHANVFAYPYIQTANLPIIAGMTHSGASTVTDSMMFICSSVASEGGLEEAGGYEFSQEGTVTAGNGTQTHLLSLQPKTTFNSITNRARFVPESVEVIVTGNSPVKWELCIGQAISGTTTFNDVNTTYSSTQFNTAGTISGSPAIVIDSGYVSASATTRASINRTLSNRYPITLDAAGAVRSMGTLSLIVTGLGGASTCRGIINWREIR